MRFTAIVALFLLTCGACKDEKAKTATPPSTGVTKPLNFIPAHFQVVASVDMSRTLMIPGLAERLRYEVERKPSLQIVPIHTVKHLYLATEAVATGDKGIGLFVVQCKQVTKLTNTLRDYTTKFQDNADVIVRKKKFNDKFIYTIRDKKQELAICQVGPAMLVGGALDKVLLSLQCGSDNMSRREDLKKLASINQTAALQVYFLSSDNIGSLLQQLNFFDQLVIAAMPIDKGGRISLTSLCQDSESAAKAQNALLLMGTILRFNIGESIAPQDIQVKTEGTITSGIADLSAEALKELFIKK